MFYLKIGQYLGIRCWFSHLLIIHCTEELGKFSTAAETISKGLIVLTVRQCCPGKSYHDGCNQCTCGGLPGGGTSIGCTKIYCPCHKPLPPPADFWYCGY